MGGSLVPRLPTFFDSPALHTASDDKSLGRPGYEAMWEVLIQRLEELVS